MPPRGKKAGGSKRKKLKVVPSDDADADAGALANAAAAESAVNISFSYMTEHLGYSPVDIIDEIINAANTNAYRALAGLAIFTRDQMGETEEQRKGMHQTESLVEHKLDKAFDSFEMFAMQNLFTFPEEAAPLLEHYKGMDFSLTQEEVPELDAEIREVQRMVSEQRKRNTQMKKHINVTSAKLKTYESCCQQLDFLMGNGNLSQDKPFSAAIRSVAEHLHELTGAVSSAIALSDHPMLARDFSPGRNAPARTWL